jgi:hypothetical protein
MSAINIGAMAELNRAFARADRLWARCKRAAIERAGGIG